MMGERTAGAVARRSDARAKQFYCGALVLMMGERTAGAVARRSEARAKQFYCGALRNKDMKIPSTHQRRVKK